MKLDPQSLETRLAELSLRLTVIEGRLSALESGRAPAEPRVAAVAPPPRPPEAAGRPISELLPAVGRTVLIIGGAFVLRSLTEAGVLGLAAGAAAGILYAIVWVVLAHRAAAAGHKLHATLFGIAATAIAYPLLWETTVSFKALTESAAAVVLVAFTVFALAVCWRDRLHGLAWVVTLGGGATAVGLAVVERQLPLFFSALLLVGLTTLWVGWTRDWKGLAATIAVPANLGVVLMTLIIVRVDAEAAAGVLDPWTVVGVQIGLVAVYLGSLVVRTLTSQREFGSGDITLGVTATVVGLGGAMSVVRATGVAGGALGALAMAMAIAGYAASFALIDQRQTGRTNFVFYTTLALACTLVGFWTLLGGVALTVGYAVVAIVFAWAGSHWGRATLSGHGSTYVAVTALVSGLVGLAFEAFTLSDPTPLGGIGWAAWIALPVIVGCNAFKVPTHGRTWGRLSWFPGVTFIGVALVSLAGVVVSMLAPIALRGVDPVSDAAMLAVVRTGVLAVAAIGLAWLSGWKRFREAAWFVYPVLVAAAIKPLVEDFRVGRPSTLVLSLALFGGALILAPRILSRAARTVGHDSGTQP